MRPAARPHTRAAGVRSLVCACGAVVMDGTGPPLPTLCVPCLDGLSATPNVMRETLKALALFLPILVAWSLV